MMTELERRRRWSERFGALIGRQTQVMRRQAELIADQATIIGELVAASAEGLGPQPAPGARLVEMRKAS